MGGDNICSHSCVSASPTSLSPLVPPRLSRLDKTEQENIKHKSATAHGPQLCIKPKLLRDASCRCCCCPSAPRVPTARTKTPTARLTSNAHAKSSQQNITLRSQWLPQTSAAARPAAAMLLLAIRCSSRVASRRGLQCRCIPGGDASPGFRRSRSAGLSDFRDTACRSRRLRQPV